MVPMNICFLCKKEIKEQPARTISDFYPDGGGFILVHMECFERYEKEKEPELVREWNEKLKERIDYILSHKNELEEKLAGMSYKTRMKIAEKVMKNPWISSSMPAIPDPKIVIKTCLSCNVEYPTFDDETMDFIKHTIEKIGWDEGCATMIPKSRKDFFELCDRCRAKTGITTNWFLSSNYIKQNKSPRYRDFTSWLTKISTVIHGDLKPILTEDRLLLTIREVTTREERNAMYHSLWKKI